MKYCAIDMDDVLGSFSAVLCPALNQAFKRKLSVDNWLNFNMTGLYGITFEQFFDVIISQDLLSKMVPYPDTRRALSRLRDAGYIIVLITSRGYHPDALALTQAWLKAHDLAYDHLIIKPEGLSKAQAAKPYYPQGFEFVVDDFDENLDHMREAGMAKELILIDQPWNRARKDFETGHNRYASLGKFVERLLQQENLLEMA
ncbi:hypothetical protein IFT48_04820 [Pseudomonas fluorescens]|nr:MULTISPECIES: hypothetical protein [Pseudomonas]MBD8089297.1 hypothetical protein [Pseudomonas fluorescens]MBD8615276.1 hypothetical protein [Pseudomonas putida]MBD8682070.1 hypothetical protein [Pseudomonas sp. CFBP 13719]